MIDAAEIVNEIKWLLNFPFPQVCRHLVATRLLAVLDEAGVSISKELISATFNADDITALPLLEKVKTDASR